MTRPSWPAELPSLFTRDGWGEQMGDGAIRSEQENTVVTVREMSSATPNVFQFTVPLEDEQLQIFRDFYNETLRYGALSFDHAAPGSGQTVRMRFGSSAPSIVSAGEGYSAAFLATGSMEILVA